MKNEKEIKKLEQKARKNAVKKQKPKKLNTVNNPNSVKRTTEPSKISKPTSKISKPTSKKPRKQKLTPMQQEYKKQQKRVRSLVSRAEKRGYSVNKQWIAEQITMPSRVTKAQLERIRSIRPENIYARSTVTLPEGGTIIGTQFRQLERQESAYKGRLTRAKNQMEQILTEKLFETWQEQAPEQEYEVWLKENSALEQQLEQQLEQAYESYAQTGAEGSFRSWVERESYIEAARDVWETVDTEQPEEELEYDGNLDDLPSETDIVIEEFIRREEEYANRLIEELVDKVDIFKIRLNEWLDNLIAVHGRDEVAEMIQSALQLGYFFGYPEIYDETGENFDAMSENFMTYLGAPKTITENLRS